MFLRQHHAISEVIKSHMDINFILRIKVLAFTVPAGLLICSNFVNTEFKCLTFTFSHTTRSS